MILDPQARAAYNGERGQRPEKIISGTTNTDASGDVTVTITATALRYLESIQAWFETPEEGDRIMDVEIWDNASPKVRQFKLSDSTGTSRGWRVPLPLPIFDVYQLFQRNNKRKVEADWEVRVIGKKNTAASGKNLYVNLTWSV
ncbi:MAG: hypothetical protein ACXABY_06970 [Candidatus Thorarchaeota archaeon]|jgi:hypothetical protein